MVHMIPATTRMTKCGDTTTWADDGGVASVPIVDGAPVCPKCWADFVKANVPVMQVAKDGE